jgi:hypothetical protein
MGHADRPREHNSLSLDAQPRCLRLSFGWGSDPVANSNGFTKCNANGNAYADSYTYNYAKCYAYSYSDAQRHT